MKRVYTLHNYLLAALFEDYKSPLSLSNCNREPGTKYMIKYLSQEMCQFLWSVFWLNSNGSPSDLPFLGGRWLIAQPTSSNVIFLSDKAPLRKPPERKPRQNPGHIIRFVPVYLFALFILLWIFSKDWKRKIIRVIIPFCVNVPRKLFCACIFILGNYSWDMNYQTVGFPYIKRIFKLL